MGTGRSGLFAKVIPTSSPNVPSEENRRSSVWLARKLLPTQKSKIYVRICQLKLGLLINGVSIQAVNHLGVVLDLKGS